MSNKRNQRAGMTAMPSTETVLDKPVFVNLQLWQRFKVVIWGYRF